MLMVRTRIRSKLGRREFIAGALAFLAGGLVVYAGITSYEQMQIKKDTVPLRPGDGEAQKTMTIAWLPNTVKRWQPEIEKYSAQYSIDPNLMAIMMTVESGGDPNADSGQAKGLMQITDTTAADINNRLIDPTKKRAGYDLKDPATSMEFAAVYIRHLISQYGSPEQGPTWTETVTLVSAGYNGGYAAANLYRDEKWQGLERYDRQTLTYARYVRTMWQERHDPLSFAYRHWFDTGNGKALVADAKKVQ